MPALQIALSALMLWRCLASLAVAKAVKINHTRTSADLSPAITWGQLGYNTLGTGCEGTAGGAFWCKKDEGQIKWSAALGGDFTIDLNLRVTDYSDAKGDIVFYGDGGDDTIDLKPGNNVAYTGAHFCGGACSSPVTTVQSPITMAGINANNWYSVVLKRVSNKFTASIDGTQIVSRDMTWAIKAIGMFPEAVTFGINYWVDVTTPNVAGKDIKLGELNSHNCPSGYDPVRTETDCAKAAPGGRTITQVAHLAAAPFGCFVQEGDQQMYFNPNPSGSNTRTSDRLVCYGGSAPDVPCAIENTATITAVGTADVAAVTARFTQMTTEIGQLQQQVTDVDTEISEVEGMAQTTATKFAESKAKIANIQSISSTNAASAAALEALADGYTTRVQTASTELGEVQKVVKGLEESAIELGTQSSEMSGRVAELESAVNEQLPGVGGITTRLSNAEATVETLRADVTSGQLEETVKTALRGHFQRATLHVQELTDKVAKENDPDAMN